MNCSAASAGSDEPASACEPADVVGHHGSHDSGGS